MKVIIGVDGSSNSFAAVQLAARLLSPAHDELVLLYATPEASFAGDERLDEAVLDRARSSLSKAVFEEAMSRLPAHWQPHADQLRQRGVGGAPSEALLAAADEWNADLIAVGFRGTSLFERFVLGSVSRAVVHSAKVPVLVVKSEETEAGPTEEPARATQGPFQSLVTYDGAAVGEAIAEVVGRFTWPEGTLGAVMTVVQPMFIEELPDWLRHMTRDPDVAAMAAAWQNEHDESVQAARHELRQFQHKLPSCFAGNEPLVVEGRPVEKLLAKLHEAPFDLVIAGSRGSGSVERMLVGSTSEQLLAMAPCSVLIVR